MFSTAPKQTKHKSLTLHHGQRVFNQDEIDSVPVMFDEYLEYGTEGDGYHFLVYREGGQLGVK